MQMWSLRTSVQEANIHVTYSKDRPVDNMHYKSLCTWLKIAHSYLKYCVKHYLNLETIMLELNTWTTCSPTHQVKVFKPETEADSFKPNIIHYSFLKMTKTQQF